MSGFPWCAGSGLTAITYRSDPNSTFFADPPGIELDDGVVRVSHHVKALEVKSPSVRFSVLAQYVC